jgi:hypothetical protein
MKDIIRHLNSQKKCTKTDKGFIYSNDQLLLLSLFPENTIEEMEIEKYKNSSFLYDRKKELFNIINQMNVNRQKSCLLCNKKYKNKIDLKKHVLLDCFEETQKKKEMIDLSVKTNIENSMINDISTNNGSIYNDSNVNITNNNINIELQCPISFNNSWDTSHMDYNTINTILFSNHLIMKYLAEVLKNENNLNVILNKNETEGLVFEEKEYVKMKKESIVEKTMDKINDDLNKFLEDDDRNAEILDDFLEQIRERLEKKMSDFKKDNEKIKKMVIDIISTLYQSKKDLSIEIYKKMESKQDKKVGY